MKMSCQPWTFQEQPLVGASLPQWKIQAQEWRDGLGIPSTFPSVWAEDMKATGISVTDRIRELLDLAAVQSLIYKGKKLNEIATMNRGLKESYLYDLYCDVSQNPRFACFTNSKGIAPGLATSTIMYSYAKDRLVLPLELLMFQGHRRGVKLPQTVKSQQIRDLAGEGMNLASLGSVIWALYVVKGLP